VINQSACSFVAIPKDFPARMPVCEEHGNVRNVPESSHYASVPDHILCAVLAVLAVLPGLPDVDNPNSIYALRY
jgi:hypothetical protein